jgi:asparagine synthase (glutamine-hydrolysing)
VSGAKPMSAVASHGCAPGPRLRQHSNRSRWGTDIFSGEIFVLDARQQLQQRLSLENFPGPPALTSEDLLLHAWAKWGPAALEHVIGDFSFALWDANEQNLWCARDFVGSRPFYYAHVGQVFCFSNTLRILRLVQEVSRELDESFLGDFLIAGWNVDPSRTVYRDIRRLPAGHLVNFSNHTSNVRCFLKLPIEEPLQLKRPEEYLEA